MTCLNNLRDCSNSRTSGQPLKFYRFPGKPYECARRQAWIVAVRRQNVGTTNSSLSFSFYFVSVFRILQQKSCIIPFFSEDSTNWMPSAPTRICSAHFVGNRRNDAEAHPSYIPTIFPPVYKKRHPTWRGRRGTSNLISV
ncbi:uncharacterized protein LOC121835839 [Ixodes scapularis]|uniref:uncharacterized protein LOC121835839 n=1 Tax=Ixodes scapularis TaxID=6945 RepID=UPI001C38FE00|nr:uncharacterized protein LOC121835839 [Ixodes scapularis]